MEIKKYSTILFAALLMLMVACKKEVASTTTNEPVVEAYLIPGEAVTVKLYYQKGLTDTSTYGSPITGQQLTISNGSTTETLTETASGTYTYSDASFVKTGLTYSLSFKYQGTTVSASTTVPTKPENFKSLYTSGTVSALDMSARADTLNIYTWSNPDSLNHVIVFKDTSALPIAVDARAVGQKVNFELNAKTAASYVVTPGNFNYSAGYRVILFRINQEYVNILKSNAAGANSKDLLNTPTNVVNGLGIFTSMQGDTLYYRAY